MGVPLVVPVGPFGISLTIGVVAIVAIAGRATIGSALATRLPQLHRGARIVQGVAGAMIVVIGVYTMARLRF